MRIILFLGLFLAAFPAYGKSTVLYQTEDSIVEVEGRTIYIGGDITHELMDVVLAIDSKKYRRVSLHSWGGWVKAAIGISDYIHKNKLATYVGRNRGCYSGCTIIYQSGKYRTAHRSAKFMYHYANRNLKISGVWTIKFLQKLVEFGVPESFFYLWPVDGGPLHLSAQQTMQYNIVQNLLK